LRLTVVLSLYRVTSVAYYNCIVPILICLSLFFGACDNFHSPNHDPRAAKGIIDLSNFDFNRGGIVKLDGEWEFYWGKLLTHGDFLQTQPPEKSGFMTIPAAWNGYSVDGKKLDGNGFATYRLTVLLSGKTSTLGFRLLDMRTSYSLFADGEKIAFNGTVGTSRAVSTPQYLPMLAIFTPTRDRIEIILQVSNFSHAKGGAFHSIYLGNRNDIHSTQDRNLAFQIFMLGSLLIMAFYHMGMFLLRRNDKSSLYLGVFCLIISIRPLVTGEYYLIQLVPVFNWEMMLKLEYLTLYLGLPVFAMFMNSLFPHEFTNKIIRPIQITGGIFSIVVIAAPAAIYSKTILVYETITLLASAFSVYAIILSYKRKREGSKIFMAGVLILFITVVNEILYDNMIVDTGNFFPFGLFMFVLSQAFLISMRFSKAFDNIEVLSGELERKNLQLENINRLKDEFLANTSHELRTPLNGIIGMAESLIDGAAGKLPEKINSSLGMIISSGRRLSNLINDLLDFSKLKNKDITLKLKAVDIKTLTDVAIDLTDHLKENKKIDVINSIPADIPLITADEDRMQQILINLIGNAIKFTESGKVEVSAQVLVGENPDYSLLEVSVTDTGIGIPEEKIPMIFQPFEQADGSISRNFGGTGIGLSITKDLLRLHAGYIEVESEPGKGSSFIFRIPLRRPPEQAFPEAASVSPDNKIAGTKRYRPDMTVPESGEPFRQHAALPGPVILVVDDDPVNLQVLENQLSVRNYTVVKSTSGADALDKINTGLNPDLVLLDVMMPKMSGLEVARILREQYSIFDLPIMMLTAKSRASDMAAGLEAGANDYLSKPFDKTELLARVKTLIRLKETVEENKKLTSIKQEIELARTIHLSTIPKKIPSLRGMEITVKYLPMKIIGGDFYDFHEIDEKRIGAFIADISGHGVPAAIIASMVKIAFYMLRNLAASPDLLLNEMNSILTGNIENQFATAGYVLIDREKMKLSYARCGHEPLMLFRKKDNTLHEIIPVGRLIGYSWESNCEVLEADIEPGDRIILYTDGITGVYNKDREIFSINFLKNTIIRSRELSASDLTESLTGILRRWRGLDEEFEDDVTIVVIDIL
jgi:two-component system, sensor histidine kinase ChiS